MQPKYSSPIPAAEVMCHRTAFTKTCRECVVDHGCRLWKHVTLEGHPDNGKPVDYYDCADSLVDLYLKDMLRRQLQTTATVDTLRKEVREGNDAGIANGLHTINRQLQAMSTAPPQLHGALRPALEDTSQ